MLGAVGYALFSGHSQPQPGPEPAFSIDPDEVQVITMTGRGTVAMGGKRVEMRDRDQIEYVISLLNDMPCESVEEGMYGSGFGSDCYCLEMLRYDGTFKVYFDTTPDGDWLTVCNTESKCTGYRTAAGYFGTLPAMESTQRQPEHPGPTAEPKKWKAPSASPAQ